MSQLSTTREGLAESEAAARRRTFGPNELRPRTERAVILQLLAHFRNPLILVLLAASVIAAFLGDVRSFVVISLIVLFSVILDFVQEYRAGKAAERLRSTVALRATVLRAGQSRELPAAELVPGDIVTLSAGDLVPADGRLLESRDFFVNQAALTGESYPVEKRASDAADTPDMTAAALIRLRCRQSAPSPR